MKSNIFAFIARFRALIISSAAIVGAVLTLVFGDGFYFQAENLKVESERSLRERMDTGSNLINEIHEFEKQIYDLLPQYVELRDYLDSTDKFEAKVGQTFSEGDADNANRYHDLVFKLTSLFVKYNKLEANLSQLEK